MNITSLNISEAGDQTVGLPLASKQSRNRLTVGGIFCAAALAFVSSSAKASVIDLGPSYRPTGADFTISGLSGVDGSSGSGGSGANVSLDGEPAGGLGVLHFTTQSGIGLYTNAAGQTQSTGLQIKYDKLVSAASVKVTVEDFDISTPVFKATKVEPSLLLFAANGSVYASFTPNDIAHVLTPVGGGGKKSDDIWNVNFSQLLSSAGKADTAISGFLLYSDSTQGERPNSDPYFLVSVGNGTPIVPPSPIPEVPAFAPLAAILLLAVGANYVRRRSQALA